MVTMDTIATADKIVLQVQDIAENEYVELIKAKGNYSYKKLHLTMKRYKKCSIERTC